MLGVKLQNDGPIADQAMKKQDFARIEIKTSLGDDNLCCSSALGRFLYQQVSSARKHEENTTMSLGSKDIRTKIAYPLTGKLCIWE